ncbi:DUF6090 family protein [Winogradskyella sp. PE311]|uniref:DUF6090 family protein n=1 Tax=Winogradskyella sp. PE311 TaxID=3366943 RepID=UPI00397F1760
MIKFFRKIRYNLMEKGKTTKYFKYAIGEIILVVIGILIALQINNWNEGRKLNTKSQELIASLIEDFEYNKNKLEIELKFRDSLLTNMDAFNEFIESDTVLVSVDSLRELAHSFFRGRPFSPNLTAYDEAKSTGNLSLLKSKAVLQQFTLFNEANNGLMGLNNEGRYSYFNGSSWELRKTVDLGLITGSNPIENLLSHKDYKAMVSTTLARAALHNSRGITWNTKNHLVRMNTATIEILRLLYEMKKK